MSAVVGRVVEGRAVAEFLASAAMGPAALVLEGEAGIGKTTLWSAAVEQARGHGFRVLSARPAAAETVLAYASLADMLADVDSDAWGDLPNPQRLAVDRALLRADADGEPTDQRAVAAAFLSVIGRLADETPVLVAIDDLQWLDTASIHVVAFAARRLPGRVGVLGSVRVDPDGASGASWLRLPKPDAVRRVLVQPLSLGGLHELIRERLGRSFPRPAMVRIQQVSGGNPFYALELARALGDELTSEEGPLPGTLAEVVRARIGSIGPDAHDALLAAACVAAPTVELVTAATGCNAEHAMELLEEGEGKGIIALDGNRIRFSHPLLARGVYTNAPAAKRRRMHRHLSELVEQPELRARHLALAATRADPVTLLALDDAAETARKRGAPAAAAELLDLAVGLGGDTPQRRIRSASHHFESGDPGRARSMLEQTIERMSPGMLRAEALSLLAMVRLFDDSFLEAAGLLERALGEAGDDLALQTQLLVTLAFALLNAGQLDAAVRSVEDAVTTAERLGRPHLLSHALGMRVMLRFMRGEGIDEPGLQRALVLEDRQASIPIAFRPSVQHALLLSWTRQLEEARKEMATIRRRCIEHGEESELSFIDFHRVLIELWRGNFSDAAVIAEDSVERALQLGGDFPLFLAFTVRAAVAAYAGQVDAARRYTSEALEAGKRSSSYTLAAWTIANLGFLEVSLGNYAAALTTLEPLLSQLDAAPDETELIAASFVPDAVEALVALGRAADAEPLVDVLERNGRRLDRAWMLAVGGRCRAMLLASQGDVDAAIRSAHAAMAHHDQLPMPFERARTQLLLGQLQRRQRQKDAASMTLHEALASFEELGNRLWAERARAELSRTNVAPGRTARLTPSEQRVAELAASGMTNRDVAAALFISPKTVEVNLSRIYRKLAIHSRAELGRHMSQRAE